MRAPPILFIAVALALVATSHVHATTVLPISLEDLVDRSDVVARVHVGQVTMVRRDGVPFRVTELTIVEAFMGARRGEVLELWQRGDDRIIVIGDPILEPDQEGLAFLRRVEGRIYLTALAQSFWYIEGQGEQAVAQRDISDLAILPLGEPTVMPPNNLRWIELRDLVLAACMGVTP
jgi:hypothetical protein